MFYGEKEVLKREDVEGGTFITVKNGENESVVFLTPKAVKYSLTEEKVADKDLYLKAANAVQEDILTAFREHDVNTRVAEFALQQVGYTLQQTHWGQVCETNGFERSASDEQANAVNGLWKKLAESLNCDVSHGDYQRSVMEAPFSKFTKLKSK